MAKSVQPLNILNNVIKKANEFPNLQTRVKSLEEVSAVQRLDIVDKFVKLFSTGMSNFNIRLEALEKNLSSEDNAKPDNNEMLNDLIRKRRSSSSVMFSPRDLIAKPKRNPWVNLQYILQEN